MTAPNRNTLWGRAIASELARSGVRTVCISPGSRSTPLTVAFDEHEDIETVSALDERSAAYFALGRARRTGEVTPLVCTSGTAAANYHPAVIEADEGRVPLLLLTADRASGVGGQPDGRPTETLRRRRPVVQRITRASCP